MTISIIGLGWLGLPLAQSFQKKGVKVVGSTTSSEKSSQLKQLGIQNTLLKLVPHPEGDHLDMLFQTDILLINIPPSRRTKPDDFHPRQIQHLKMMAENAGIQKIIYVSSTSVYPNENQIATENEILNRKNTGNPALWEAENLLWEAKSYDLTVVRFGGLLGVDRVPGRYFSARENVAGHPPVNYIHRNDAVKSIEWIIKKDLWNQTYNIVCLLHPSKKEVFEKNAKEMGFPPPKNYHLAPTQKWKQISPEKFLQTGFKFQFQSPLDFTYEDKK
ncbi:MAG: NAD(P)-binding domain-containing protein [Cyclobacteriaceae bacterium]